MAIVWKEPWEVFRSEPTTKNFGLFVIGNRPRKLVWNSRGYGMYWQSDFLPPSHLRRCPPSSSHARPLPSARPAMKGAPGRESFPGILRMWRRPGMLEAAVAVIVAVMVVVVAVFSTPLSFHLLAIHGNSTIATIQRESCRRPSDGTSNWVELSEREDHGCRVRSGHYLRGVYVWMRSVGARLMSS